MSVSCGNFSDVELSPSDPYGDVTQPLLAVSGMHRQECLCHPEEKAREAIGARGGQLEFSVNAVVEGHDAGEYTHGDVSARKDAPSAARGRQKTGACASRPHHLISLWKPLNNFKHPRLRYLLQQFKALTSSGNHLKLILLVNMYIAIYQ